MNAGPDEGRRLRVAVVVGTHVPAWIIGLLDDLVSSERLELVELAVASPSGAREGLSRPRGRAERVLAACDARLFAPRVKLTAPADLSSWATAHGVTPAHAGVGAAAPDVVLDLTTPGGSAAPAGDEVPETWALRGVPLRAGRHEDVHAAAARDLIRGAEVTTFELSARDPQTGEPRLLDVAVCPTHPTSPSLTCEYLAASARQLLVERLEAAAARRAAATPMTKRAAATPMTKRAAATPAPGHAARAGTAASPVSHGARGAGAGAAAAFAWRTAARQARKALFEKQWHLLVGEQDPGRVLPDPTGLRPLVPGPGRYWADPFVLVHEGRTHVFFEEFVYATRRGRIATVTLDAHGREGAPQVALELGSHLSYPCVFTHEGRVYMVPESAGTGTLDLYECLDMPTCWVHRRTLLAGVQVVDASVVEWGGLWWMFASLKKPAGLRTAELLVLSVSEDPVAGEWRPHPLSPLLADITNARPAGAPFVVEGRLYRPAQDGAGGYGRAITINEVLTLTAEAYTERRVVTLRPDWARGIVGTHTLNRAGPVVVMDACRSVRRDPRRPRAESMME